MRWLRHRTMIMASYLPLRLLLAVDRRWPRDYEDGLGWTFWTDAHYWQYCRQHRHDDN